MSSAVSASPPVADPLSVKDGYERWAPLYDHGPNPLLAREERYLLPVVATLPGKHFLDLACGTGRWIGKLLSQGRHSGVGLDCSAAMLRVASAKQGIRGRLARASCESLPFRSAAFGLAFCSFALGHIEDLAALVRELARVTEDGADVFVSDLHPEAYTLGWRVGFRHHGGASQIAMIPRQAKEISHAFSVAGFECNACESLWLGEPERTLFEDAGKSHAFAEACRVPAVLVCRFKRISSPCSNWPSRLAEAKA